MSEAVYVVQAEIAAIVKQPDGEPREVRAWEDFATITVPARTHRKTVIEKALEQAAITPVPNAAMNVRVLDEQSARETRVETEQPPPRLKLT
jgi:hypothetical protein